MTRRMSRSTPAFDLARDVRRMATLLMSATTSSIRWRIALALGLVIAGAALSALAPLALQLTIDTLTRPALGTAESMPQYDPTLAIGLALAYVLSICAARWINDIRPWIAGAAEHQLLARVQQRIYAHLMALPLRDHLDRSSGALSQSLQQAVTGLQLLLMNTVHGVLPVVVELSVVLAVLTTQAPTALGVTFIVTAACYLVIFTSGTSHTGRRAAEVTSASQDLQAAVTDGLLNIEAIKLFGAESQVGQRQGDRVWRLGAAWIALHRQRAVVGSAITAVFAVSLAITLVLAADAVVRGDMSIGAFVLTQVYMLQMVRPLDMLGAAARDIVQAQAFVRPVLALLARPREPVSHKPTTDPLDVLPDAKSTPPRTPTLKPAFGTRPVPSTEPLRDIRCLGPREGLRLELRQVHVRHGPHRSVLQDLDLVLDAGQTLAIVGASGAGKTTLIRLLTGLIPPDRGEVLMDGQPVCPVQPAAWRACIGVVPQDPLLMDDTLAANIALGRPDALRQDIMRAAVAAQLHAAIERMPDGYDTRVGQRGQRLSGGERQRVAIARALLRQPRLLVLDEATSMLDTETERRVLEQVTKACQGRSTLIIAHRLSTVRHADEIVVLAGGRVAERGTHEQLLVRRGLYADMWEAHAMRSTFPARGP